ncbi:hypothetical protein [Duffyella gerundensis]|uniref:hypothetical protein n=1 Tax=Duffyella gerundensis TaxID=1619313 RepID=UPI003FCFCF93
MNSLKILSSKPIVATAIVIILFLALIHQLFHQNFATYLQMSAYISLVLSTISNSYYFRKDERKLKILDGIDVVAILSYSLSLINLIGSCIAYFIKSETFPSPTLPIFLINIGLSVTAIGMLLMDAQAYSNEKAK